MSKRALFGLALPFIAACAVALAGCGAPPPSPDDAVDDLDASRAGEEAVAYLASHRDLVDADGRTTFEVRDVVVDPDGTEHVRLDRREGGLRVVGGDVVVHGKGGVFDRVSRTLRAPLRLGLEPRLRERDALRAASDATGRGAIAGDRAELVVYARRGVVRLAYEAVLHAPARGGAPSELHVVVGADDGAPIDSWNGLETAVGKGYGLYSGEVSLHTTKKAAHDYELVDATRGGGSVVDAKNHEGGATIPFSSADDVFGNGSLASRATVAADVAFAMAKTWDYFHHAHGRNGPAGHGKGLVARVHFGSDYANAFYSSDCECLSFGDGGKDALGPGIDLLPLASLDVVAHELTHAVTHHTAKLIPSGESGALDEATSDIFAAMVEHDANLPGDPPDWLMGEQVVAHDGGFLRSMPWPEKDGRSIGCYEDDAAELDPHAASGVANHFFYLLAQGTGAATHTCGTGASFKGIGRAAAAKVWYRALTVYLTSDATFADARAATLAAAEDLYGAASTKRKRVAAAWDAVLVP